MKVRVLFTLSGYEELGHGYWTVQTKPWWSPIWQNHEHYYSATRAIEIACGLKHPTVVFEG